LIFHLALKPASRVKKAGRPFCAKRLGSAAIASAVRHATGKRLRDLSIKLNKLQC
jgi:hypothetical protein